MTVLKGEKVNSDLIRIYKKIVFSDSVIGVFINPFFISRRGLFRGIRRFATQISGGLLLDIGCGSKPYEELFQVDEYIGLDIEKSGHDHSSSKIDVFYDGNVIPFKDQHFDHVFSSEVFEHVFNLDDLLVEINRVTKTGGTLLVTVPFCWDEHEIPYDFARYSSYGISSVMHKHGFEVISQIKTTTYIGTIFQMIAAYISQCLLPKNRYFRVILNPLLVCPFTILGLILGSVLPDNGKFFLNNVVLCRKR